MGSYDRRLILLCLGVVLCAGRLWAQHQNVRVSNPANTNPEEVTIAINPADPLNLVAGANIDYYYYSTDGGGSWIQGRLSSTLGVWGDPSVVFDGDGNAYYAHLSWPRVTPNDWLDRIVVQKSTTGGATWTDGVGIGLNGPKDQDKEWLAVDLTNSAFRNRIYAAWTEFDLYDSPNPLDSSRILFSRSLNFGVSWSTPVRVSDRGGDCLDMDNTVEGAVPAIGPNGEVYLSWSGPLGIMFDKSTDGGATFGPDIIAADQPGGWAFVIPGISRANGFPVTACDVSASPFRGTIYIGWTDQRNGLDDTDVFLVKSTDGGVTWSSVKRVNDDVTTRHQFFSWLTVDPVTGFLYMVFYDRRATLGNATDVYGARSTDGGETFQNFKVSQSSFAPVETIFFGDYTNIAAFDHKVYPIWMRMDNGNLSIWTAPIMDTLAVSVREFGENVASPSLSQNYPNPFNPTTTIRYTVGGVVAPSGAFSSGVEGPDGGHVRLVVYDILGREVAMLVNEWKSPGAYSVRFDAAGLAGGVYFYSLHTGNQTVQKSMVLLR